MLTRVTNKTEEVKSLRDGVFNATSLREASKGIELNRAAYVFTTFFALPFLNNQNESDQVVVPPGFKTSMIVIPILTYLISLVFDWYVRHMRAVKQIIQKLRRAIYSTAHRLIDYLKESTKIG